jgi:superfamily II DNA/RNA helicase
LKLKFLLLILKLNFWFLLFPGKEDVFAISTPRSGKFGAFILPILHTLLETGPNLNTFFACVLSPKW